MSAPGLRGHGGSGVGDTVMTGRERTLFSSEHFVVALDEGREILRLTRLEAPFTTPAEAVRATEAAFEVVERARATRPFLLFDISRAPGRNDPEFERAVAPVLRKGMRGFKRTALVVRSAAGKLQIKRFGREIGGDGESEVFFTEEEARVFLRTGQRPGD